MKILVWLLRVLVFVALFGLAIKNDRAVELRFYFDNAWQLPLSLVLLAAFAGGVAVGLSAALATLARQWRELGTLRKSRSGDRH
ncbi:MAG TPA: LapA family protein [Rhodocyclaceae bacterium]